MCLLPSWGKLQGFEARFPDRRNNNNPSVRWIGEMDVSERWGLIVKRPHHLPCAADRPAPFLQRTGFGGVSVAFADDFSSFLNTGAQQTMAVITVANLDMDKVW
jgi:hypothetical protein